MVMPADGLVTMTDNIIFHSVLMLRDASIIQTYVYAK